MSEAIKVDGIKEVSRYLKSIDKAVASKGLKEAGKEGAEIVATEARTLVPVRSGKLQRSIKATANQRTGLVKAGGLKSVPYAGPIHFGWGRHNKHPQPFVYDALDHRRNEVIDRYTSSISRLIEELTNGD